MKRLPTIAMTPMPEYGYFDPLEQILKREKQQTLRKGRHHGRKEITVGGKRTGIVIEFCAWRLMYDYHFLTHSFALADGFVATQGATPMKNLRAFLEHFYGEVPEAMWCNHFRVVQRPEEEQK